MPHLRKNQLATTGDLGRYSPLEEPAPALTATARIYGGPGVGLAEIQACIEPPNNVKGGKILAVGVPRPEVEQVLSAVLKIPSLTGRPDYDLTVRLVGAEKWNSSFGLAVTAAIISSYLRKPILDDFVFMGEVDLMKTIRGGSSRLVENLRRSIETSEVTSHISLVLPLSLRTDQLGRLGVRVIPCATLLDVIAATWNIESR